LADGAAWIWNLVALHFPYNGVEILNDDHASGHLATAAKTDFEETSQEYEWQ